MPLATWAEEFLSLARLSPTDPRGVTAATSTSTSPPHTAQASGIRDTVHGVPKPDTRNAVPTPRHPPPMPNYTTPPDHELSVAANATLAASAAAAELVDAIARTHGHSWRTIATGTVYPTKPCTAEHSTGRIQQSWTRTLPPHRQGLKPIFGATLTYGCG
jgi:hypothetical protein